MPVAEPIKATTTSVSIIAQFCRAVSICEPSKILLVLGVIRIHRYPSQAVLLHYELSAANDLCLCDEIHDYNSAESEKAPPYQVVGM